MKILPFESRPDADALLGASSQNELARADMFAGVMRDTLNESQRATAEIRPAGVHTSSKAEEGASVTVGNVPASAEMTIEDVVRLREELEARGVRKERLAKLTELASSGDQMTLGKVLSTLRGSNDGGPISDADKMQLRSLFQKLGLDEEQSGKLLSELENGNGVNVWNALRRKMRGAGGDGITLEGSEADALARALGVSAETLDALRKSFGGAGNLTLGADGMQQIFASVEQELTRRNQQDKNLESALGDALNPVLQRLRARQESEGSAKRLGAKVTDQSEALMHDTFQRKTGGMPTAARNEHEAEGELSAKQDKGAHGKTYLEELLAARTEKRGTEPTARSSAGEAWDTLLSRVQVVGNTLQQGTTQQVARPEGAGAPVVPQQVLSQLEKGFLSGLQDGSRRMELHLDPAELGALSVVLTVRNGEVSAVIRPERAETAQLVNDHLHQLRQQLEQQGVKVERLEVQTQLSNNQYGSSWQGMDQHNQTREQQERNATIERMRRMAKLGDSGGALAQEMQNPGRTADSAAGLHLIA